jgi:hypothetical protein
MSGRPRARRRADAALATVPTAASPAPILPEAPIHVTIQGALTPREALEAVEVTASWNGAASTPTACSTSEGTRTFTCEHTYTAPSSIKGYPITLRVKDDEGNQASHQLSVHIP